MEAHAVSVFDNVLRDPTVYRQGALAHPFGTHVAGGESWHGMSLCQLPAFTDWLADARPDVALTLSLLRQSPYGQREPNFIHTDGMMGDWTAILYLSADPAPGDGTRFWRHRETGAVASASAEVTPDEQEAWNHEAQWDPWHHVEARFNRAVIFPARYFHSRTIRENYGQGHDARLIQVVFGVDREKDD